MKCNSISLKTWYHDWDQIRDNIGIAMTDGQTTRYSYSRETEWSWGQRYQVTWNLNPMFILNLCISLRKKIETEGISLHIVLQIGSVDMQVQLS